MPVVLGPSQHVVGPFLQSQSQGHNIDNKIVLYDFITMEPQH